MDTNSTVITKDDYNAIRTAAYTGHLGTPFYMPTWSVIQKFVADRHETKPAVANDWHAAAAESLDEGD